MKCVYNYGSEQYRILNYQLLCSAIQFNKALLNEKNNVRVTWFILLAYIVSPTFKGIHLKPGHDWQSLLPKCIAHLESFDPH